jgi:predicted acetyltransferase
MRTNNFFGVLSIAVPVGVVLVLAGCSARQPTAEIAAADIAVKKAEKSGAGQHAALEMHRARQGLDEAREKANDKRTYDSARRLAEKSRVDAELAEAKSRAVMATDAAREQGKTLDALRSESERGYTE